MYVIKYYPQNFLQSWHFWDISTLVIFLILLQVYKHEHLSHLICHCSCCFNSLRPSDAIWRQWSWTTLVQVMACCLTAPSHYLNQCWLIIKGVLWHSSENSFTGIAQGIDSGYEFEKDILKNIFKSPRGQWVKSVRCFVWIILFFTNITIHLDR